MNPPEGSEEALRAAFVARLETAPEPTAAMLARTLAAVAAESPPPATGWRTATRWWSALAAPARLSTAAAIVIVGGTLVVGSVKASHERISPGTDGVAGSRITFERHADYAARLAYHSTLQLGVRDVAASARRVDAIVRRERGTIIAQSTVPGKPGAARTMRLLVRVRSDQLAATLDAMTALGTVLSRTVGTEDIATALAATSRDLRAARAAGQSLAAAPAQATAARRHAIDATIARLTAHQATLEQRAHTATLAVLLRERREPSPLAFRLTSNAPARGIRLVPQGSDLASHRARSLGPAPSGDPAAAPIAGRTAAGGDGRTGGTRNAVADTQTDAASNANANAKTDA